jgi:hypothetical protein
MAKAKGFYNDILDSTRGEYERAMYGRRTTEDLDIVEDAPEYGSVDTRSPNEIEQEQEIDDDMDI